MGPARSAETSVESASEGVFALSATVLTAWRLKRAVLAWRAMLPKWQSGNNQAPEAGVRPFAPPLLATPPRNDHNRHERQKVTRRKMAALPALLAAPALANVQAAKQMP
jgi:hypothetical protein